MNTMFTDSAGNYIAATASDSNQQRPSDIESIVNRSQRVPSNTALNGSVSSISSISGFSPLTNGNMTNSSTWSSNSSANTSPEDHTTPPSSTSEKARQLSTDSQKSQQASQDTAEKPTQRPKGKRKRRALSCNFCRQRKLKCDRQQPCSTCTRRDTAATCRYSHDDESPKARGNVEIPQPAVDAKHAQSIARGILNYGNRPSADGKESDDVKRRLDQMENLVMTILMNNGNKVDSTDLGITSGLDAVRQTSIIRYSNGQEDEIDRLGESLGLIKLDKKGKCVYHGDTHWCTLFSDVDDAQEFFFKLRKTYESINPDAPALEPCLPGDDNNVSASMAPFQGSLNGNLSGDDVLAVIPPKEMCDVLVNRYFLTFQPMFPVVHRPTFEEWYEEFWENPQQSRLVWVALLLGMISLALLSYLPAGMPAPYRNKMTETVNKWVKVMETCGHIGKITNKPSLLHIRVMLLWLFAQGGTIQTKDWLDKAWISMGLVVRAIQGMGMHRDSKWFAVSAFECEERRRLFSLIKYWDVYFSVTQGLPLGLRTQEADVSPPTNCNITEIMPDLSTPRAQPISIKTDASFSICRDQMARMAATIIEMNSRVDENRVEMIAYDQVIQLDKKIRAIYDSYPPYFKVRCDRMSAGESDDLAIHRFMLEIEYLKTLVLLHRPFMSAGVKKAKYRLSRDVSVDSSLEILKRHCWLFQSPNAAAVRSKYWWPVSLITFQHFVHAAMYVSVLLMNHYDKIPVEERTNQLFVLQQALPVMSFAHFSPMHDTSQSLLLHVLVGQVMEVAKMTPLERAARVKRKDPSQPAQGMTVELVDNSMEASFQILNGQSPNQSSEGVSPATMNSNGPFDRASNGSSNSPYGTSSSGPPTGKTVDAPTPNYDNWNAGLPLFQSDAQMMNVEPFAFDPSVLKNVSQAVSTEEWDNLMSNLDQNDFDFNMLNGMQIPEL